MNICEKSTKRFGRRKFLQYFWRNYHAMNIEDIREYCLQKAYTDEAFPFDETTLVFRLMGKIFACVDLERPNLVVLKCEPDYALELRDQYRGIEGAWHWNKRHWNQIYFDRDVPDTLIRSLIDHSYEQVYKKIPRKVKAEYES